MHATDVLVIGAGIAGGIAALKAARQGARVILLHRSRHGDQSNTHWAQGGIIYCGEEDAPGLLEKDIQKAGAGICLPEATRVLAEEGPKRVEEVLLGELGVEFDQGKAGQLDRTAEGAHSVARIIHCDDRTGLHIHNALMEALKAEPGVDLRCGWTAVDILTLSHHSRRALDIYEPNTCVGAYVLDRQGDRVETILAQHTVLATGGLGQLFLHTTNPRSSRGDGLAMAYRAGARLLNLEYIQFHPTALFYPPEPRFLISESMRGEGARLIRRDGSEFMERYDRRGSLAPRDIVARAIHEELLGSEDDCVYLEITHRPAGWIRRRFPRIQQRGLEARIHITKRALPVVPAAHYTCGGVATDLWGRTNIDRLWAVGEVACTGLHGANRLASTSLLEGLVFGERAARAILRSLQEEALTDFPEIDPWIYETEPSDPALILQDWLTIRYTMWNYVGLIRTQKRLKRARQILRELQEEVEDFYDRTRLDDDLIGLRNGVQAALAILYAASENRVSRGCHYLAPEEG